MKSVLRCPVKSGCGVEHQAFVYRVKANFLLNDPRPSRYLIGGTVICPATVLPRTKQVFRFSR